MPHPPEFNLLWQVNLEDITRELGIQGLASNSGRRQSSSLCTLLPLSPSW